jgi:uncharacterized protein YeeX (DUF496 family)
VLVILFELPCLKKKNKQLNDCVKNPKKINNNKRCELTKMDDLEKELEKAISSDRLSTIIVFSTEQRTEDVVL